MRCIYGGSISHAARKLSHRVSHIKERRLAMQATQRIRGQPAATPPLKRSLGLWMATALVIGNMIGSGVFLLPASLASASGPISIVAWLVTGLGALALVFAN